MAMNKTAISIIAVMLCGCVDPGRVGIHPELKTVYFDGQKPAVENCLYSAALSQKLSLMKDDPLPGGTQRYNLQDANYEDVAWVDVSSFGKKQTSVDFYYAPHAPDVELLSNLVYEAIRQRRDLMLHPPVRRL